MNQASARREKLLYVFLSRNIVKKKVNNVYFLRLDIISVKNMSHGDSKDELRKEHLLLPVITWNAVVTFS